MGEVQCEPNLAPLFDNSRGRGRPRDVVEAGIPRRVAVRYIALVRGRQLLFIV